MASIPRRIAAWGLLVFLLAASSVGAACEARCAQPAAVAHGCCPVSMFMSASMSMPGMHSGAVVAMAMACHHPADSFFSESVAPVGLVAAIHTPSALDPGLIFTRAAQLLEPLTAPSPLFPLRI